MNDKNQSIYIKIYDHLMKQTVLKPMNEHIIEMVASQMPISFELEALKAQAIIARTFIIRRLKVFGGEGCLKYQEVDLCTDGHCGPWLSKGQLEALWNQDFKLNWRKIQEAVEQTKDQIITINNKPIEPKYHCTCGGATENSENIDDNKTIYLRKVLCDYCMNSPEYHRSVEMTLEEIEKRLNIGTLKASPLKGPVIEGMIEEVQRDEAARVVSMKIGGKEFKGTDVKQLLGLNSTRFGWKPIAFQIEMQGMGEGLGLCQYGANTMALQGSKAEEILKYYFTGVQIKDFEKRSINKPLNGRIIVLDPGHGGDNTEDVVGPTGLREKDVNLSISLKLSEKLRREGAEVYETRVEDTYVSLSKRASLSKQVKPDFFISIHQNFFSNPNISGSEIYYYRGDKESEILANYILEELSKELNIPARGAKVADFYLLREVRCSVMQIEVAFITNPEEEAKMMQELFQEKAAEAIFKGFMRYYCYE